MLINKTEEVLKDPEYQVTLKDLQDWEKQNGPIPDSCVMLFMFGWASKYPDRAPYLGIKGDDDWDRHFPSISGGGLVISHPKYSQRPLMVFLVLSNKINRSRQLPTTADRKY